MSCDARMVSNAFVARCCLCGNGVLLGVEIGDEQ
jgi:hypothetical protein